MFLLLVYRTSTQGGGLEAVDGRCDHVGSESGWRENKQADVCWQRRN